MKSPVLFKKKLLLLIIIVVTVLSLYYFFLSFFSELTCSSLSDLRDKDEVASALRTAVGSKQVCCCYLMIVRIEHQ